MFKFTSYIVLWSFIMQCVMPSHLLAQAMVKLPAPGTMVALSDAFKPAQLQGMVIDPKEPFKFDFLVYRGDEPLTLEQKQSVYRDLIKYFLASLAVPEQDQWVNLSPYENKRIINESFGMTQMGRDLLAQDYLLKQITASLMYLDDQLGKKFWDEVYHKAHQEFGTSDIPMNTFNKVWIIPDEAAILERDGTALILKSHLKVMLEQDYMALRHDSSSRELGTDQLSQQDVNDTSKLTSDVVREILLPAIEREVNEGRNFANLRQIVSGMILAAWFKKSLKESVLGQVYADQRKVRGVDQDPANNQAVYEQYVQAFRKGAFNMIREDVDRYSQEVIPRKYFSGGYTNKDLDKAMKIVDQAEGGMATMDMDKVSTAFLDAAQAVKSAVVSEEAVSVSPVTWTPENVLSHVLDVGPGVWVQLRDYQDGEAFVQRAPTGSESEGNYFGDGVKEALNLLKGQRADEKDNKRSVSIALSLAGLDALTDAVTTQYTAPLVMRFGVGPERLDHTNALSGRHAFIGMVDPQDITQVGLFPNRTEPMRWAQHYLRLIKESGAKLTPGSKGERFYQAVMAIDKMKKIKSDDMGERIVNVDEVESMYRDLFGNREFIDGKQAVVPLKADAAQGKIVKWDDIDNANIKGGIDLNAANLNMQIKRDGAGMPLPVGQQDLSGIRIDGLVPVILDIQAVTALPALQ